MHRHQLRVLLCGVIGTCCVLIGAGFSQQLEKKSEPPKAEEKPKDKAKEEKVKEKENEKEKEKEKEKDIVLKEVKPEPETPVRAYTRQLGSEENPIIRKRLVIALMNQGKEARSALPLLLLAGSPEEPDFEVRKAALTVVLKFTAVEVVETLLEAIPRADLDVPQRRMSCKAISAYYFHPTISPERRKEVYAALEGILADADGEVRLAAATALEAIDRKESGAQRVVQIRLDGDGLRRLNQKPDQVLETLKQKYPRVTIDWVVKDQIIEWRPNDPGDATLLSDLGRTPIVQRSEGAILLREVATFTETSRKKT